MKIGEVGPISEQLKSKYKELQHYSYMQCLGSYFELTLLFSILDCLLVNNNEQQIQQIINPGRPYSQSSQIIANKIQKCILKERKLSLFYEQVYMDDHDFIKTKEFLSEYCNIYKISIGHNSQDQLNKLSDLFQISLWFFGELYLKIQNKKQCIYIYKKKNQYHYIKQYFESRIQKIEQKVCFNCKQLVSINFNNQKNQNYICNSCNQKMNLLERDSYPNKIRFSDDQFQNKENKQFIELDVLVKKIKVGNEMEQEKWQPQQKQLICMKCKDKSQTKIFTNQSCNHNFCLKCLSQLINALDVSYSCLEANCRQSINTLSYYHFYESCKNDDNQIQQKESKAEYTYCSGCSKKELQNLQFTNLCLHTFCRNCSIKFAKNTSTNRICPHNNCQNKISYEQLNEFFKSEKILFQCSKCEKEEDNQNLFQNTFCSHFFCINCSNELFMGNDLFFNNSCPIKTCFSLFDKNSFKNFFELNQEKKVKNSYILSQNNNEQKMEIQENDNENDQHMSFGECTFCFTKFSDYNLPQKLQCKKHQIGVCCSLVNINCPQCAQISFYMRNYSAKSKLVLQEVKQDFDFYNFQTTSQKQNLLFNNKL